MSQQDLLNRLEAAITRLEALGVSGGAAAPRASTGDEMDDASTAGLRYVMDFEAFKAAQLPKFFAGFEPFPSLARHKAAFEAAWANQERAIRAAAICKKPSDQDLVAFLAPSVAAMDISSNVDRDAKGIELNLQKALADGAQFLAWPVSPPTFAHVEAMRDSSDMWLNRALTEAKSLGEADLAKVRGFVQGFKVTLTEFAKWLKENAKMGLDWNPAGKDFGAFTSGAAPAAAAAPKAAAAPVAAAAPAAPVGNPLAGLNRGLDVTQGLKKVTDDMKTKNQKDLPPKEAPKPKVVAKAEPVAAKPPSVTKQGDNVFVEWQWNQPKVEVNDVTVQTGVYIGKARNSNIYITGKPKSVAIDGGFRVAVFVPEFLAQIELVNCDRVQVFVTGAGGSTYAVDKSKGCIINFSDEALARDPTIVASNISECNIQQQRGDDLIEVAIPEQYEHKIVKNTATKGAPLVVTANPVSHG